MKRFVTTVLLSSLCYCFSFSQIVPVRQVVSNGGKDTLIGRTIWASTIGEAVVSTFTAGSLVLTQGFQQPDGLSITPFIPFLQDVIIYPNPARPNSQLRFYLKSDQTQIEIRIFDAYGKLYQYQKIESYAGQTWHSLNPQIMSAGTYIVKVYVGSEVFTGRYVVAN